MKKAILSFGLLCMAFIAFNTVSAQTPVPVESGPQIEIDKEVHDYGTIEQGANGECIFLVTNTGDEPLEIKRCKGSCGCTVPQCSTEPVLPGKTTEIRVKYDTKRIGPINKSVTIESNSTNSPVKVIRIKGQIKAPVDSSPTQTPAGPVENK